MKNSKLEILAPGGSLACIKTAIDSGADAVYFAGQNFGARTNAVNLTNEEITEAVSYAHIRGAKLYVTVNTLIGEDSLESVYEFIKFCYISGIDAVIVQDFGIVNMIKTYFPDMKIHASTQMTVHNIEGVLKASEMGIDRVVLSRELSFDEIRSICEKSPIELEVFVHGALCMSYSGQCMMSSFIGGRSGNKGSCAQPCRLPYTLQSSDGETLGDEEKYLLSLKDLCLIEHIKELKSIGVTSLKIEGRMKGEAYVSAVTGLYNKYRDGGEVLAKDLDLLKNIFSRGGFTKGYFEASYGRDMLSYNSNHDDIFSSATEDVISEAKTYASVDRTIFVKGNFTAKLNEFPKFEIEYNSQKFCAKGINLAEKATNVPSDADRIRQQLSKLGGTVFGYKSLNIDIDDGIYIPVKDINNLRREAFDELTKHITRIERNSEIKKFVNLKPEKNKAVAEFTASVLTYEQAQKAYDLGFQRIYVPYGEYIKNSSFYNSSPDVFTVKLPPVIHDFSKIDIEKIKTDGVCITNIGQFFLKDTGKKIYADYRLNAFNSLSVKELKKMGADSVTLSPELTIKALKCIYSPVDTEILVYGRVSMMTMRNCVIRSSKGKCQCRDGEIYYLKDRKNICFPLVSDKLSCTNVLYNSAPIVMSDRMNELKPVKADFYRFDFTTETPDEIERILNMYEKGLRADFTFTRGHFYKGVI